MSIKKTLSARIDPEIYEKIEELVRETNQSRSAVIEQLLQLAVIHHSDKVSAYIPPDNSTYTRMQAHNNLEERVIHLEEKLKTEIANLTAKLDTIENMPSHNPQEEVINVIQVSEAIIRETEPVSGIDAERLAPIGIQAKELREILDIPQSTLSDWGKRRERGEGKPRQTPQDKWDEFMSWEKRDRRWYK